MNPINKIKEVIAKGNNVALWGASKNNINIIHGLKESGANLPCSIIDSDTNKHGSYFLDIPVLSFENTINKWHDIFIWVAEGSWKTQVVGQLTKELDFPPEKIIYYEPVIWRKSCPFVDGWLICGTEGFRSCCPMPGRRESPIIEFNGDCDRTINNFLKVRERLFNDIISDTSSVCSGCTEIKAEYYSENPKINTISYASGGICNLKCIYCQAPAKTSNGTWNSDPDFSLIIDALKERDVLSENLCFEIAPGETAINRNKSKYYSLFSLAQNTMVMTNATIYDNELAELLSQRQATLCVSVDAGTRETYRRIRGADLFDKLCENLKKYDSIAPGSIDLKYIFIPGENDTSKDVSGFVDLCSEIHPSSVLITYDYFNPLQSAPPKTVKAVKKMITELKQKQLIWKVISYILENALGDDKEH